MKSKIEMAHDYAMKHLESLEEDCPKVLAIKAWKYVDTMQAEEDKRKISDVPDAIRENSHIFGSIAPVRPFFIKDKGGNCMHFHHEFGHKKCMDCGACLEHWQPDWSQAPSSMITHWSKESNETCTWWIGEPCIDEETHFENPENPHSCCHSDAPSFDYKGDWKNSLRKRP